MRIARDTEYRQSRTELHLNTLPQNIRDYIAGLETELERCQRKLAARRKQDRDRDRKLELANLKRELFAMSKPLRRAV
jgi:hypothetical protein